MIQKSTFFFFLVIAFAIHPPAQICYHLNMTRVQIQPEMLQWARERAEKSVDDLSSAFPKLIAWEEGTTMPTVKQLENFAKRTWTPFGYFFLNSPPEEKLPIPDFRTVGDQRPLRPSPNLLETVHTLQRRQEWLRDYLIEDGAEPLAFVGCVDQTADPLQVAQNMRTIFNIGPGWAEVHRTWQDALRDLRHRVEDAGVITAWNGVVGNNTRRTLDVDEFRGFVLTDEYAPVVFINTNDAKAAQMFTLAHELAHLLTGSDGVLNLNALQPADYDVERFCNRVAAEFLVPAVEFRAAWPDASFEDEPFKELARKFKVSPLVAARRTLDLNFITRDEFFSFYNDYVQKARLNNRSTSGGNFYATAPLRLGRPFAKAVIRATREGKLLYRNAYHLTGLHGKTFDTLAKKLEVEGV